MKCSNKYHVVLIFVIVSLLMNCKDGTMVSSIQEVKAKNEDHLLNLPGVVSVGIGKNPEGESVIIIGVDGSQPETEKLLPQTIEGYPVRVERIGPFKAL